MIRTIQELKEFLSNEYTISYRSDRAVNARVTSHRNNVNRINIDFPISKEELMKKVGITNGKN